MSEYIITIDQIKDLVMQSSAEAIDAYRLGAVKWNWQYPLLPKIVRCRDCKYHEYLRVSYLDKPLSVCVSEQWVGAEGDNPLVKSDGFCKWGERKD